MSRTIVHLDADAFFASVEQAADARLRGKSITAIVGGFSRRAVARADATRAAGSRNGIIRLRGERASVGIVCRRGLGHILPRCAVEIGRTKEFTMLREGFRCGLGAVKPGLANGFPKRLNTGGIVSATRFRRPKSLHGKEFGIADAHRVASRQSTIPSAGHPTLRARRGSR